MKVSFITTVFNEEKTVGKLLKSVLSQSYRPYEIVVVDGGSKDDTIKRIRDYETAIKEKGIKFKLIIKKGNRSVGRNEAVKNSAGDVIACSDAGNILEKNWLKNIISPFGERKTDVVAGYYEGIAKNTFHKSLIPYVLIMPDRADEKNFLPATRSMAFKKSVWEKIGGFDERYSHNEDFVFANKLKKSGFNIFFKKSAIVRWIPRSNLKSAFVMFLRFAIGDAEAGIMREKVLLMFSRYIFVSYFLLLCTIYKSLAGIFLLFVAFFVYLIWAVIKNYKYVSHPDAFFLLPVIQLISDFAVMSGTLLGILKRIFSFNYLRYIRNNKFLFLLISVYVMVEITTLRWGIPNLNHPFPYHMDEWHQLNAVRATAAYGTPNIEGAAHGTMFHFLTSAFYLAPFTIAGYINPIDINIDDHVNRQRIFELLRINSIFYGVLATFFLYKIAKLIKSDSAITILLFTFTPIWLMLSGYFKYDIALTFWIILSVYFILLFGKNPTPANFLIAAVPVGLTTAVKVSGFPIHLIYFSSFFILGFPKIKLKILLLGVLISAFCAVTFGIPDILFGRGDIFYYITYNLFTEPELAGSLINTNPYGYLLFKNYPLTFGYGLVTAFVSALIYFLFKFAKRPNLILKLREEAFILFCFLVFFCSLMYLGFAGSGNRALVVFPFIILIVSFAYKYLVRTKAKTLIMLFITIVTALQIIQSFSWISIKLAKSPQEKASEWIAKNVAKDYIIGLENIPIYQMEPDLIQKEFYFGQYDIKASYNYKYDLVDDSAKAFPGIIVITNGEIESKIVKGSPKKKLTERLKKEGFVEKMIFKPDLTYYYFFGNDLDYYLSGLLVASPLTTTVYQKN
jgi:glycosyltransferase involved in cell wall biosynthesis